MVIEEVIDFLGNIPPFQQLDAPLLKKAAESAAIEFYPRGTFILVQDGPPSEFLRVIRKGGVKVFIKNDKDVDMTVDYRSEGDLFGFLSVLGGDKSRANVFAIEDTLCYRISRESLHEIMSSNPAFREFFLKTFLNKYIDKTYRGILDRNIVGQGGDKLLFTTRVGEISTGGVVTAPRDISIQEAAGIMVTQGVSSLVLVEDDGSPAGIITDKDLRDKVVSKNRDVAGGVSGIMNSVLIKTDAQDFCFEVLLKMIKHNIHHLVVVDKGRMAGVVTNHDLMLLQGTSPISIVREIETQTTAEGLIPPSKKVETIIGLLLKEGTKSSNIARVVTEINDRIVRKILETAEKKYGVPPVRYCWVGMGSEGRKEQVLRTDQDNGIIHEDPASEEQARRIKDYFRDFTGFVRKSLEACGFAACPADVMASNPHWCQPVRAWKKYFLTWISEPSADNVLKSQIFFDLRPLYGDERLADELRYYVARIASENMPFLGSLANTVVNNPPPIGFFKSIVVEKDGQHKNELNLKVKGTALLSDIVRFFSIEKGIAETSTFERIEKLKSVNTFVAKHADELEHAYDFLMFLRTQNDFRLLNEGERPDHFIDPNSLSKVEKRMLKEAYELVEKVHAFIIERYKVSII
ncbi:MAG: cyclic nucleotide-binding/CBS domain-containing protein [Nitrospirae bacterium]|nr:cyclic nucleotide-binding/CBS domain-containing protein [Nitrospirota bacterium]